jgi:hypothetical protein
MFKLEDGSYRLFNENNCQFGEGYQESIRSPEWKAALIVYEKYKRKMDLEHLDLIKLKNYIVSFSENRKSQGKKVSNDYLIQECSAELKRWK